MTDEAPTLSVIQFSAMTLLAMREHSKEELRKKLQKKFGIPDLIEVVLSELTARNLQSDERFAEAFVKMRIRQGKGPVRILYELKEKGIAADVSASLVDPHDSQWGSLAREVCERRFGNVFPQNDKEKAKGIRFLQYRGFASTHIWSVFK